MRATKALSGEAKFLQQVAEALKGDHNDLRREAIILRAHRAALAEALLPFQLLPEHGEVDDRSRGYNQAVAKVHQLASEALAGAERIGKNSPARNPIEQSYTAGSHDPPAV